jgi:hypothetical protein
MLERLGQSNEIDPEVSSVWVEEAEMRDSFACAKDDSAMDNDELAGIPVEQVFQLKYLFDRNSSEFIHPCNEKRHISSADRARTA